MLWEWRKGVPGGGAFYRCEGRLRPGAPPPQTGGPLGGLSGSAVHMLWARVCGCGGPALSPRLASPLGAACRGAGGGPSLRVVACHRCEGRVVSGAVPPPAACPLGRAAGVPRPVCPGCGPALLAVEVAEGRPRGGCLSPLWGASEVRRSPSPDCPPTGRAVGVRHPRAVGAAVWVWGPSTVPLACMPCLGCV